MRIVSFLPSATETLYQLGAGNQIVGVTHECKFPPQATRKPRVIHPSFDPDRMSGQEIDRKIVELVRSGKDIYLVEDEILKQARPDLIVAQGLCEVCSPFTKEISRAVKVLGGKPDVLILDPHNLDDILNNIMKVAEKIGRVKQGEKLVSLLQKRIDRIKTMSNKVSRKDKPKVLCIEWLDPLFTAGHWVPQMVEYAGGINGISSIGEPSRRMDLKEVIQFDPDIIVLMPCGFDIKRTLKELPTSTNLSTNNDGEEEENNNTKSSSNNNNKEKWKSLRAVQNGNVYAVNANAYFSKPGPRTITGLEILAKILHPELTRRIRVPKDAYKKLR
jgi:iron complex transport system substrate-binding protein